MSIRFTLATALMAILPFLSSTTAVPAFDATFIGCTRESGVPASDRQPSDFNTVALCQTRCYDQGNKYSYFAQNNANIGTYCICSDTSTIQPRDYNDNADDNTGGCMASDTSAYTVSVLSTPYDFQRCYEPSSVSGTATSFTDFRDAMDACTLPYITFVFSGNNGNSYCSNTLPTTTSKCYYDYGYTFLRTAAEPSGVVTRRKRMLDRLEAIRRAKEEAFCPKGLNACKVNHEDAYECIDTQSELESCGGCTLGLYGAAPGNSTIGTDCTILPGVKKGAVTCSSGKCTAFACQDGYKLVGSTCSAF